MSQDSIENFGAYCKAMKLFDFVVKDMAGLKRETLCFKLISQQIGSSDSICANIEEGHGRESRVEYARFLDIARGSARETRGRYVRMRHWLSEEVVTERIALASEIIGILTSTINRLKDKGGK